MRFFLVMFYPLNNEAAPHWVIELAKNLLGLMQLGYVIEAIGIKWLFFNGHCNMQRGHSRAQHLLKGPAGVLAACAPTQRG